MILVLMDEMKDRFDEVMEIADNSIEEACEIKILTNDKITSAGEIYSDKYHVLYDALTYFRNDFKFSHVKHELRHKCDIVNKLKCYCGIEVNEDDKLLFVVNEELGKQIMTIDSKIEKVFNVGSDVPSEFATCEYLEDADCGFVNDLNYSFVII